MPAKGTRSGYMVCCENCGKEVYKTKSQYEKAIHHFCSNTCQKDFQHKQLFEMRKCEICGKEFEVSKKSSQRFCSIRCQGKWQSTQTGLLNPRFNRIKYPCDYCGKDVYVMPCEERLFKHHFCGDDCRVKWYQTVFSQDELWKEESRLRAAKILADGKVNLDSKPQRIVNGLLQELGLPYTREKQFVYYSVDNYLDDHNLIIEVMGDYWHGSPVKFTHDKLRPVQKDRIGRDKAKHTYILNQHHIEILYLWEKDILCDPLLCSLLIKYYVNTSGHLKNYHSFNYHLTDNCEVIMNDQLIIPYQDIKQFTNA